MNLKRLQQNAGLEILRAVCINSLVFWHVGPW